MFVVNHYSGIICTTTRIDKHNCLKLIYQEFKLYYSDDIVPINQGSEFEKVKRSAAGTLRDWSGVLPG